LADANGFVSLVRLVELVDWKANISFAGHLGLYPRIRITTMKRSLAYGLRQWYGGFVTESRGWKGRTRYSWHLAKRDKLRWLAEFVMRHSKAMGPQLATTLKILDAIDKKPEGWQETVKGLKEEIRQQKRQVSLFRLR
jgi:hypothetical protein